MHNHQTPLETTPKQRYHEPLVFCLLQFLERDPRAFAVPVMESVLRAWPEGFQSNSPKVRWNVSVGVVCG